MPSTTFLDALAERLSSRAAPSAMESPVVAVLWPDEARAWEPFIPLLRTRIPVLTLGTLAPAQLSGPAYWIRCVLDGTIGSEALPPGIPTVYLPGHARTEIRAVEDASEAVKPLAELQYRGLFFAQSNGRDWTIQAFLESKTQGLGVDVADDQPTREALLRARTELASTSVEDLRSASPLRAGFFDELLAPDLDRDILRWLDDRAAFEATCSPELLSAFGARVAEQFHANLSDGEIAMARLLGVGGGRWAMTWQRYAEAPTRYPGVEDRLRAARPERKGTSSTLFEGAWGSWPQDNLEDEDRLRSDLIKLGSLGATKGRDHLAELAREHAGRRQWVWAALGQAPLAFAIDHLGRLAEATRSVDAPTTPAGAMAAYVETGWRTDDAVIRALGCVRTETDRQAVGTAMRAAYREWLEETARRFQGVVGEMAEGYQVTPLPDWPSGTVVVFFDGCRLDIGRRLETDLRAAGREVSLEPRLAALPTITPCAKPAVSPVASELGPGSFFAPARKTGGADLTVSGLRGLLTEADYQVLELNETGDPTGRAWTELGDLDEIGHLEPWNLPEQAAREVEKLSERINVLLDAGWTQTVVVTDHGWLYLPGGLPKVDLPLSVTKDDRGRKGRTARLAEGAKAPDATVPWYWDPQVRIAVAPGIAAFVAGAVYEHGGVTPQECVTPVITVRNPAGPAGPIELTIGWSGLRARVSVTGATSGATVDIRRKAGDVTTSLIGGPRPIGDDGQVSALVEDEDTQGLAAFAVVHDASGRLIHQDMTTVGGES